MGQRIIFAPSHLGLGRATSNPDGSWKVDHLLPELDIRCLASDPNNSNVLFAGTQNQGILRSTDAGLTWHNCGLEGEPVKSIAVSPHDPRVIFAGTRPAYMHKSEDGGITWQELEGFRKVPFRWWWFSPAESPWQAYVQAITISPTDPDIILAGIEFGAVLRSEDGGLSWSGHRSGALRDCHSLKFHATHGDWAYEAGGTGGGAAYSRDGGKTWHKAKNGLTKNYGVACAADPVRPEIWYVSVAPGPGKAYGEFAEAYLYRANGGAGWEPIGWEPHPMRAMPLALATDREQPGNLYAGLVNGEIWHTSDYGDSWQKLPFRMPAIWLGLVIVYI